MAENIKERLETVDYSHKSGSASKLDLTGKKIHEVRSSSCCVTPIKRLDQIRNEYEVERSHVGEWSLLNHI